MSMKMLEWSQFIFQYWGINCQPFKLNKLSKYLKLRPKFPYLVRPWYFALDG